MKLIKIGTSSSCDIVLRSEYVSAHHADIIVLDDGKVILEDKGSTNGTFVGRAKKRIKPGVETIIKRGEYVCFADTELMWLRIPTPDDNSGFKTIINIGSHNMNDVVIGGGSSRFHASLKIDKKGRAFIIDHGSKNGTIVNGTKIAPEKLVRVNYGDNVLCADQDVSETIKSYVSKPVAWLKWCGIAAACIALVAGLSWGIYRLMHRGPSDAKQMIPATVYVFAAYHFNITLEDNPISVPLQFQYPSNPKDDFVLQATAFFIDRVGHMATNRHVALPWNEENRDDAIHNELKQAMENYLLTLIPKQVKNTAEYYQLSASEYGRGLIAASKNLTDLNAMISRVYRSKIVIDGEMDYIAVGYPGKYFSDVDELDRCNVICESGTKDKDVAILQLNNKETPASIKYVFNLEDANLDKLQPMDFDLYTIGYPTGIKRAMDLPTKSLTPSITVSKCSKTPSKFTFEMQQSHAGGSSGSPVFDKQGRLVGILSETYSGNGAASIAVQVRYLKDLYQKEELDKQ